MNIPHFPRHLKMMPTSIPPGAVIAFAGLVNSKEEFVTRYQTYGWLLCNGDPLSIKQYPALYNALGNRYNLPNDPGDTFRLPDYRGYFLRMVDDGAGRDPDVGQRVLADGSSSQQVGSIQNFAMETHVHEYDLSTQGPQVQNGGSKSLVAVSDTDTGAPVKPGGGNVMLSTETRPMNMYVYYLVKYL
jgi:microcystin-dependent protein